MPWQSVHQCTHLQTNLTLCAYACVDEQWVNLVFAAIFTMEAILKLLGLGWRQYFKGERMLRVSLPLGEPHTPMLSPCPPCPEAWNRFDFTIVVGTIIGLSLKWSGQLDIGAVATIIRVFRMGRYTAPLSHKHPSQAPLTHTPRSTIWQDHSLGALGQVVAHLVQHVDCDTAFAGQHWLPTLLALLYLCRHGHAALFPRQVQRGVERARQLSILRACHDHSGASCHCCALKRRCSRSCMVALCLQVRCSTGESWNLIMWAISAPPTPCKENPEWNDPEPAGCGSGAAHAYFFSFMLVVAFVMLNVFIAVSVCVCVYLLQWYSAYRPQ